jgi:hypothetical protein
LCSIEPAWAATYSGNNEKVLSAVKKLDSTVEGEVASVKTMIEILNAKVDNKVDSIKNTFSYSPLVTSVIAIAVSGYVSVESSKKGDRAVDEANKQVDQRVQQGLQQVFALFYLSVAVAAMCLYLYTKV